LEICEVEGVGDFDFGFAYEVMARVHVVVGNAEEVVCYGTMGFEQVAAVVDLDECEVFLDDLAMFF